MKLTFYYNVSVTVFCFSRFLSVILNQSALHKFQRIILYILSQKCFKCTHLSYLCTRCIVIIWPVASHRSFFIMWPVMMECDTSSVLPLLLLYCLCDGERWHWL